MSDDQSSDIEGFILAGGLSSRMGTNKAQLKLAGRTFVACIGDALSSIANGARIVGAKQRDASNDLQIVPDVYAEWGALGGVHAALHACRAEWALIVACDLPFASAELFRRLASLRENFDAVAPLQQDGRAQPLCALYRVATCRNASQALIEQKERRPRALLQTVQTRWMRSEEFSDLKNAAILLMNVNTPKDYEDACAMQVLNSTGKGV